VLVLAGKHQLQQQQQQQQEWMVLRIAAAAAVDKRVHAAYNRGSIDRDEIWGVDKTTDAFSDYNHTE